MELDIQNVTTEQYKQQLLQFHRYLVQNKKLWAVFQIRNAMVMGYTQFIVGKIEPIHLKTYVRWEFFRKYQKVISEEDYPYYHKKSKKIVMDYRWRNRIDFYTDLGLNWHLEEDEASNTIFQKGFYLVISWTNDYSNDLDN